MIGIGVDQVQTVARNRATETVIGRNLFPYKEVRSSNPVATFVALEGLSRLAIWGRTKTKVSRTGTTSERFPRIRRPAQGVRWQFAEAVLVGSGKIAEVPEAPSQRFFGDRC